MVAMNIDELAELMSEHREQWAGSGLLPESPEGVMIRAHSLSDLADLIEAQMGEPVVLDVDGRAPTLLGIPVICSTRVPPGTFELRGPQRDRVPTV